MRRQTVSARWLSEKTPTLHSLPIYPLLALLTEEDLFRLLPDRRPNLGRRGKAVTHIIYSMTKLGPSRQVTKRRARDDIRAKMVLGVDLNIPPLEGYEQEASSGSIHPPVSQRTSVSVTPRCSHPTGQQQGSLLSANYGTNSLLIDVDAIEDEVQLLSSSRGFPQVDLSFCSFLSLTCSFV
ncbi:hypothetical protein GW17_00059196 [Ensete ventricosum]|nr:hypothetical protein GW17_00059196 [Ensete ventricosum]